MDFIYLFLEKVKVEFFAQEEFLKRLLSEQMIVISKDQNIKPFM